MAKRTSSDGAASTLNRAVELHQAGRLEQADRLYRSVLRRDPNNANALHLSGLVAHQMKRSAEALERLGQAVSRNPASALFRRNLALAQQAAGETAAAIASFRTAHDLAPGDAGILNDLGTVLNADGQVSAAAEAFRRATALAPDAAIIHYNLGNAEHRRGHTDEAIRAFRRAVAADPQLERARHVLAALTGEQTDRPPDDYVRHLFDDYAERFDEDLVGNLGYRVPALLREALARLPDMPAAFAEVLDLGCGTGLSGQAMRDIAGRLTGIDLSAGMVAKAEARGIYDRLETGELADFLAADDGRYDLVLATDVLVYVGELRPLFAALSPRSAAAALVCFSTELAENGDVVLQETGRFAHGAGYIARLADEYGYDVLLADPINVRQGKDGPIAGELYVLKKR